MIFEEKRRLLLKAMDDYTEDNIMLAFSGGVDSSLLLRLATDLAKKKHYSVFAVTAQTNLHPMKDVEVAREVAQEMGARHQVVFCDELQYAGIEDNPVDRCYRCKKYLFQKMMDTVKGLEIKTFMDGTNADDFLVYRPGIQALQEFGVKSPLAEAQMTKEDVRKMAEEYHISVADRPSAPCLATRFPYGTHLDPQKMHQVDLGELALRELGFYNVRIRVHGDIARLEVDRKDFPLAVEKSEEIVKNLKELGFVYISLDLEGFRSGSMDVYIEK